MAAPINLFFLTCLNRLKTRTGLASMYFFIFANVANDLLKFLATRHNFFAKCEVANAQRYPREVIRSKGLQVKRSTIQVKRSTSQKVPKSKGPQSKPKGPQSKGLQKFETIKGIKESCLNVEERHYLQFHNNM